MILIAGDPHGQFQHLIDAVLDQQPVAVIILGDLELRRPLEVELAPIIDRAEVWFIHGNHDTDTEAHYDNLFGSALAHRNLHGRVVEIDGLRIAGLGGVFRKQVWMPPAPPLYESEAEYLARCGKGNWWRGGLPRKHRSTIFPEAMEMLRGQRADVLASHEAPSAHPHGFAAIDCLARSMGAHICFHGHHHDSLNYSAEFERMGIEAYGINAREVRRLVLEVDGQQSPRLKCRCQ